MASKPPASTACGIAPQAGPIYPASHVLSQGVEGNQRGIVLPTCTPAAGLEQTSVPCVQLN